MITLVWRNIAIASSAWIPWDEIRGTRRLPPRHAYTARDGKGRVFVAVVDHD